MPMLIPLFVGGLLLLTLTGGSTVLFASLPVPREAFCAACRRRRAEGKSEPGSLFGVRADPFAPSASSFHAGVDVVCPSGTDLLAVDDGVVTEVRPTSSAGMFVRYETAAGRVSCFHLSRLDVRVGDVVAAGQVIGATGATGRVTGAHLHLEFKPDRAPSSVDPLPFFPLQPRDC
jgi:murein DD-endopeptidase MepM/ murein hydrolase activator NlpD